jgi:hypothetical protein
MSARDLPVFQYEGKGTRASANYQQLECKNRHTFERELPAPEFFKLTN